MSSRSSHAHFHPPPRGCRSQVDGSKTYYVTEAICEHLDDLEDLYLAERERVEVRAGRSVPISLQAALSEYGLED